MGADQEPVRINNQINYEQLAERLDLEKLLFNHLKKKYLEPSWIFWGVLYSYSIQKELCVCECWPTRKRLADRIRFLRKEHSISCYHIDFMPYGEALAQPVGFSGLPV